MIYVLYLVYAVGTQPVAQHLGTFESPESCTQAMVAYAEPRSFPANFVEEVGDNFLKCRPERKA